MTGENGHEFERLGVDFVHLGEGNGKVGAIGVEESDGLRVRVEGCGVEGERLHRERLEIHFGNEIGKWMYGKVT